MTQAPDSLPPVCMGCQSHIASPLFCFSCNSLQRLSSPINYFEALGLPYTYELDLEVLEQKYQTLVAELHPDFYLGSSAFEKKQSERSSSLLNLAYTTLKHPSSRANYLLDLISRGRSDVDFQKSKEVPEGFLLEIFEYQESLDEWKQSQNHEEITEFSSQISERIETLYSQYSLIFKEIEEKAPQLCLKSLRQLKMYLNTESYLQRLLEQCRSMSHFSKA